VETDDDDLAKTCRRFLLDLLCDKVRQQFPELSDAEAVDSAIVRAWEALRHDAACWRLLVIENHPGEEIPSERKQVEAVGELIQQQFEALLGWEPEDESDATKQGG
jgi:hypothetical protein